MMGDSMIRAGLGISVVRALHDGHKILDDIKYTYTVRFLALLGPNGAGKAPSSR